jgi:hypothetical protein
MPQDAHLVAVWVLNAPVLPAAFGQPQHSLIKFFWAARKKKSA